MTPPPPALLRPAPLRAPAPSGSPLDPTSGSPAGSPSAAPPEAAGSTRDRVVAAATAEFARHGIAGARVDRIAKAARTSKERVYAHFAGKEELYRLVCAQELAAVARAARLDPADLPAYAGRLHDHFTAHPERLRLVRWGQLELGTDGSPPDAALRRATARRLTRLRAAQAAGLLDPGWDPQDVLVFVDRLATAWADRPDRLPTAPGERAAFLAARRAAVVAAVERLFPAARAPDGSRPTALS
ncbi:TetR family transcriptional regulator [Kitasatospora sp. NPDC088391]|uniref:TetR family transcriptional regulator n=1 Tax=Kitasatospora sp. NPDC088391 TaxID=3364074 RepID=UPI0037FE425C